VVRPNAAGTDVSLSMVHAGAGSAGLEWKASEKDAFAVYHGADYFGRNSFRDTTDWAHPETFIGFGGPGYPNTNNRAIQQLTFDWLQTLRKNRKYGALQFYTQYSYLTRAPWFVAQAPPRTRISAWSTVAFAAFCQQLQAPCSVCLTQIRKEVDVGQVPFRSVEPLPTAGVMSSPPGHPRECLRVLERSAPCSRSTREHVGGPAQSPPSNSQGEGNNRVWSIAPTLITRRQSAGNPATPELDRVRKLSTRTTRNLLQQCLRAKQSQPTPGTAAVRRSRF